MNDFLPMTPEGVTDQVLSSAVSAMHGRGELAVNEWTANARPASGWNLESFMQYRQKNAASVPQFPGAQASGQWFDMVKPFLAGHEGNETFAYHGALSSHRKAGKKYVERGHNSTEEVSVGYGFNLQRRDARSVFKQHLGMADGDFDEVFNGQRGISPAESEKLLTYAAYEANAQVDNLLRGVPLRAHQRAALVSLTYNAGIGSVKDSGILEAVRAGNDAEAASRILAFNTLGGELAGRRRDEASLYMGARAQEYFAYREREAQWLKARTANTTPHDEMLAAWKTAGAWFRKENTVGAYLSRLGVVGSDDTRDAIGKELQTRFEAHLAEQPNLRADPGKARAWLLSEFDRVVADMGLTPRPTFPQRP